MGYNLGLLSHKGTTDGHTRRPTAAEKTRPTDPIKGNG